MGKLTTQEARRLAGLPLVEGAGYGALLDRARSKALTSYGWILCPGGSATVGYDEVESIEIFTDEKAFWQYIALLLVDYSGDNSAALLNGENIDSHADYSAFCDQYWHAWV